MKKIILLFIVIIFISFIIGGGNKNNIQKEEDPIIEAPVNNLVSTIILTEKEKSADRKKLEIELRNGFLDDGEDIKVSVSGKNNTIITLKYPLFNDVWFRRYEKTGIFKSMHEKGFKKVVLTDGYDYNKYAYWK